MTKFMDKSFSTYAPGDSSYRDNWEATFGKRTSDASPCAWCAESTEGPGPYWCGSPTHRRPGESSLWAAKSWKEHIRNFLADHLDVRMSDRDIDDLAVDIERWAKLRSNCGNKKTPEPFFDDSRVERWNEPLSEED